MPWIRRSRLDALLAAEVAVEALSVNADRRDEFFDTYRELRGYA